MSKKTSKRFKFLTILFATEVVDGKMTIDEVPAVLREAVINYIKETFGIDIVAEDKEEATA